MLAQAQALALVDRMRSFAVFERQPALVRPRVSLPHHLEWNQTLNGSLSPFYVAYAHDRVRDCHREHVHAHVQLLALACDDHASPDGGGAALPALLIRLPPHVQL